MLSLPICCICCCCCCDVLVVILHCAVHLCTYGQLSSSHLHFCLFALPVPAHLAAGAFTALPGYLLSPHRVRYIFYYLYTCGSFAHSIQVFVASLPRTLYIFVGAAGRRKENKNSSSAGGRPGPADPSPIAQHFNQRRPIRFAIWPRVYG